MIPVQITVVSDTHCFRLEDILKGEEAQLALHCGDLLNWGTSKEWYASLRDLEKVRKQFKHFIAIGGNHDLHPWQNLTLATKEMADIGVIYLTDQAVKVEGLHIYGSPWVSKINGRFAWELPDDEAFCENIRAKMPANLDILMTHTGPEGIMSGPWGCPYLLDAVKAWPPRFHVFGHVHSAKGQRRFNGTTFYNAAICNEKYDPVQPVTRFEIEPKGVR